MQRSKTKTMPIAELIEDMDLYPRHAVDAGHVAALTAALEAGCNLPPVVADKKSKRLVDGWHRLRAYRKVVGNTGAIDVELVEYPDEAAIKFDSVARNAAHGRKLDVIDRTRSVIMLRASGFNDSQISQALHTTEKRVQKLAVKYATAPSSSSQTVPGSNKITLKRSVSHLLGEKLTKGQAEVHSMLPGTSFLLVARQLSEGLRHRMVNLRDVKLVEALRELRELLQDV